MCGSVSVGQEMRGPVHERKKKGKRPMERNHVRFRVTLGYFVMLSTKN